MLRQLTIRTQEHPVGLPSRKVEPHIEEKQQEYSKLTRAGHLGIKGRKCSDNSGGGDRRKQISESTEEMNAQEPLNTLR